LLWQYASLGTLELQKHVRLFLYETCPPWELYEIFALPGVLYENLALITGHCMEYTLACIWCYYYDDGLETHTQPE